MTSGSKQSRRSVFIDGVGFDGAAIPEDATTAGQEVARRTVAAAFDRGIRFFDVPAPTPSQNREVVIADTLYGRRDLIRLCTKGGRQHNGDGSCDASYAALRSDLEDSLFARLCTDHVDVHLVSGFDNRLSPEAQMENLQLLRDEGLADEVGFAHFPFDAAARALATGIPSVVSYRFNLLENAHIEALVTARLRGCTRVTSGTEASGLLAGQPATGGEAQPTIARRLAIIAASAGVSLGALALAATLREGCTDVALVGSLRPSDLEDMLSAAGHCFAAEVWAEVGEALAGADLLVRSFMGSST